MKKSISQRFIIWMAVVITSIFVLFFVTFIRYDTFLNEKELKNKADHILSFSKQNLASAMWQYNNKYIIDYIDSLLLYKDVIFAQGIIESKVINTKIRGGYEHIDFSGITDSKEFIIRTCEITYEKNLVGKIIFAMSKKQIQKNSYKNSLAVVLLFAFISTITSIAIIILFRKNILKPVLDLNDSANKIADGDLNVTIDTSSDDEIGQLAKSFSDMMNSIRMITASRDELNNEIVERKKVEGTLRKSERRLREAQRVAKIGHWELDTPSGTPIWSEEIFHIFGLDPTISEPSFAAHKKIIHEDDWRVLENAINELSTVGKSFDLEFRIKKANNDIGWMHAIGSAKRDENGHIVRMFGTAQDISTQKHVEEALRKRESDLALAQSLAHLGNWSWDATVNKVEWSNEMYHIYGVDRNTFSHTIEGVAELIHPDDLKKQEYAVAEFLAGRSVESYEYRTIRPDGNERIIEVAGMRSEEDENGQKIKLFGVVQDITERKMLESKLQQAQKMESIGQLAGGIAHDFNNILYPVIGFAQLSQTELPKDHPVQENLQDILDGAIRAKDLVKRILHFSRQKEPELKPTILKPVIKETQKLLRSTIPSNVNLQLNLYDGQDAVLCDDSEIHEIILNLCTNAYHAIAGDKGQIKINLEKQNPPDDLNLSPGEYLCLSVKDDGVGIPEKIKDKIFEPYVTTKEIGQGSGLGLSVVYGIVQNYNGGINVNSDPKTGTVFEIFLPITDQEVYLEKDNIIKNIEQSGNKHVLFVDDENSIVKLGVRALKSSGYRVSGFNDSAEALKASETNPDDFDLVITDMAMPNIVGSELTKRILEIRPDIPIIICSGYSEKLDRMKVKELKVSAFLDKPLTIESLLNTTKDVLNNQLE